MPERFQPDIYGLPEWSCGRSRRWVLLLCAAYALVSAGLILSVLQGRMEFLVPAAGAVAFFLWRLYWLQVPVALICRDRFLVLAGGKPDGSWKERLVVPAYWAVPYRDIAGFSERWNEMYLGTEEIGGLTKLPVPLASLSLRDRESLCRRIEEKQRAFSAHE